MLLENKNAIKLFYALGAENAGMEGRILKLSFDLEVMDARLRAFEATKAIYAVLDQPELRRA